MEGPHDKRRGSRAPAALLLKLTYGTLDEFVEKFASNVSRGGLFIRTREPRPVGTLLAFELRLARGETALKGEGVVRWIQPERPGARPPAAPGMGVQFTALDDPSRAVVERIVALKERATAAGTGPVVAPRPETTPASTRAPTPVIPVPPVPARAAEPAPTPAPRPPVLTPAPRATPAPDRPAAPAQADLSAPTGSSSSPPAPRGSTSASPRRPSRS